MKMFFGILVLVASSMASAQQSDLCAKLATTFARACTVENDQLVIASVTGKEVRRVPINAALQCSYLGDAQTLCFTVLLVNPKVTATHISDILKNKDSRKVDGSLNYESIANQLEALSKM